MRKTTWMLSRKIVNRAVLAGIAFSGISFAGNAYAELAISKQLTTPMTKIEGNKYRVDFSMRVLNSGPEKVSGIVIKDSIKADLEAKGITDVSQHPGVEPRLVEVPDGDSTSIITGSPNTASAFLASEEGTILGEAELKEGEFLVLRYTLDINFGENTNSVPTNSKVFSENVERDTSNNGEFPENHSGYRDGDALKDSPTTIYFPKYDNVAYEKDSVCKVALGDTAFESSYELIKNGGFFTKPRPLAVDEKFIASDTLLADSFTSGAQYAGNNAFPSHETDDGRTGAQISIRNDVALHNNSAQQYSFPGDPDRPFVEQTNSWLFSHGNKTGGEVDVWKQDVELVEDKIYNFSMYVSNGAWPDPGFSGEEHPEIQVLVDGSPVGITLNNGSKSSEPVELPADDDSDDWKLVQGTFIAPKEGTTTVKIMNSQNGHNYNYLAITGIGLHRCALAGTTIDTDGDGKSDEVENAEGSNPDSTDNTVNDVDGDGIADHLDENDNDGKLADIDNDGLTNEEEEKLGTDPNKSDTDGDGKDDKTEVGDDVNHPKDSDNDCKIDALESSAVDSDGDGQMDEKDAQPTSCTGGGGGGGTTGLGLLAIMTLPVIMRRRRKDG